MVIDCHWDFFLNNRILLFRCFFYISFLSTLLWMLFWTSFWKMQCLNIHKHLFQFDFTCIIPKEMFPLYYMHSKVLHAQQSITCTAELLAFPTILNTPQKSLIFFHLFGCIIDFRRSQIYDDRNAQYAFIIRKFSPFRHQYMCHWTCK